MSEADDHAVSQPQMGTRWFVVLLVAGTGVIGLGVWEILEGRTGTRKRIHRCCGISDIASRDSASLWASPLVAPSSVRLQVESDSRAWQWLASSSPP